ncbi:MAG: DUF502 domain-containing protein [Gammaproteobacteria bacterium]|nr:DUF502 domain-containing protein [Gammaproteobacteria bacterium]MCP5459992.1 DUF502 domain-containing protein [Gammaproteobacteria bacterium]
MLRSLAEFTKTTLIGGVLVIFPIWLTTLLLVKTLAGVAKFISPVTSQIPAAVHFRHVIALLLIIIVCFLAGLIVRTGPGSRAKNVLERKLLGRIPGYDLIRGLTARLTGRQEDETFAVALVELEEALVPAFIVEEHDDGAFTVFVPSVPTPAAGSIYILPRERVHRVDVPFTKGASVISRWGAGARDLRQAMQKAPGGDGVSP